MKRIFIILFFAFLVMPVAKAQQWPFFDEVQAYRKQDSISAPPRDAILFIGSSSFRLWKNMQDDFPGYAIINRGLGGSSLPDIIHYADEMIFAYKPKQIIIYCGDNDLAASDTVTAETVVKRFSELFELIRNRMSDIPIVYVSIKPSPSREKLLPAMMLANKMIKDFLKTKPHTAFADVFSEMMSSDGKIRTDIFLEDKLHMNAKGYAIWIKTITPYLLKD
ncbi:MAG: G-D-S-L family lipolytic protein [Bacteroidetes bacterium]|nr:G-D-S-L family lipolytic protein [Bacteroidota bacterium]